MKIKLNLQQISVFSYAGSKGRSPSSHVRFASSPDRKRTLEHRQGPTGIIRRPTSPIVPDCSSNKAIEITGITQSRISNIGTVNIALMKSKITFYVVHSDFPISRDGILGREYIRQEKVEISFQHNMIVTHSNPTKPIPCVDNECRVALDNTTDYKGPMLGPIQVRARTRQVIPIAVINTE